MNCLWWICTVVLVGLGALGLLEKLISLNWGKRTWTFLLAVFLLISLGQIAISVLKERHAVQDLYEGEITETFPKRNSAGRISFYADSSGNKCASFCLRREPIQNSVHLWEGGYHAPPMTLDIKGTNVVFKFSAFSSHDDYAKGSSVYQIKYIPKP